MKQELLQALTNIHLSFDVWTSPNALSILSVFAYYINSSSKRQRRLIAYRRLVGMHSGENIASTLSTVITEYEILARRIRYFMCDNTKNNDKAINLLLY